MAAPDSEAKDEFVYHYGPEPVLEVSVKGELLLLTAWARGTWNEQENKWSEAYLPLIPSEALARIDRTALRPKDIQRVPKTEP